MAEYYWQVGLCVYFYLFKSMKVFTGYRGGWHVQRCIYTGCFCLLCWLDWADSVHKLKCLVLCPTITGPQTGQWGHTCLPLFAYFMPFISLLLRFARMTGCVTFADIRQMFAININVSRWETFSCVSIQRQAYFTCSLPYYCEAVLMDPHWAK